MKCVESALLHHFLHRFERYITDKALCDHLELFMSCAVRKKVLFHTDLYFKFISYAGKVFLFFY